MADVQDFFSNYLPNKFATHPEAGKDINAVFVFDIGGAGTWTVDLTKSPGEVRTGGTENPGVTIETSKADFESLLDNPASGMMMAMTGKLKVKGAIALALQLQKILS